MIPFLFSLLLLLSSALAFEPTTILHVQNITLAQDCTNRPSVVFNGTSPGPVLRYKEGDHVWIRVYNELSTNTTVHFHGLSQYGSPFADGTPQTSQWPIAPHSYFDYEFMLPVGSAGFYHSHVGFAIVTAYGAFIVEEATPPYSYDEDLILMFGDIYHASDKNITDGLLASPFAFLGEPQAMVLNGNALGNCTAPANSTTACSTKCHHDLVNVQPSTTYRLRMIGVSALTFPFIGIQNHSDFSIIEVDGNYIQPTNASYFQLHSGQRYSALFKTKSELELAAEGGTRLYWGNIESRYRPTRDMGAFVLNYEDHYSEVSTFATDRSTTPRPADLNITVPLPAEAIPWVESQFQPLKGQESAPYDSEVTRRIYITSQQLTLADKGSRWYVNGNIYNVSLPDVPYLVQAYQNPPTFVPNYDLADAGSGYDASTGTFPVKVGETIEFVITNEASDSGAVEAHPWHFHGQHPWLIASGLGNFSDSALFNSSQTGYTPKRPILRDTAIVFPGEGASYGTEKVANATQSGWTVLRMKAETPGAWLVHCHIQPHMEMGMALVMMVGVGNNATLPSLPAGFADEYLTYNATPAAEPRSYFAEVGLPSQ